MAHMIEDNQLAYANATPWHGLGVSVPEGTTGAAMLTMAGLDWKVEKRALAVSVGPKGRTKFEAAPMTDFVAITRGDTGRVFQVATKKYQLFQNAETVDFFREYCEAGHATMETVGAIKGGAVVWALAKLKGGDANLGGVDPVHGYMLLSTSHDASLPTAGRPTQVRVVCNNTLTAALRGKAGAGSFRMLHNTKWTKERKEEAQRVMGLAIAEVAATNDLAAQLSKITINESDWLDYMGRLMGGGEQVINPKTAELTRTADMIKTSTLTSPGADLKTAKGTLWGAVNGVTHYADHRRGFSTTTTDSRMAAAWFGEGNNLKNRALAAAVEMAGITA